MSAHRDQAVAFARPTAHEHEEVQALIGAPEAPTSPRAGRERGFGQLIVLMLLSADPYEDEPIEDSSGSVMQNLTCAVAF